MAGNIQTSLLGTIATIEVIGYKTFNETYMSRTEDFNGTYMSRTEDFNDISIES